MKVPVDTQREFTGANMTPMIDVVFLLIIFFLVSSHLARQENRLPVELPTAATHQPLDMTPVDLTITVDVDGRWLAAGRSVQSAQLQGMLDELVRENPRDVAIRIRTDGSVNYSVVEPILGHCAQSGIVDVRLAVKTSTQ
ncbi:ExbD/TolR family protein [Stieleria bergensis]